MHPDLTSLAARAAGAAFGTLAAVRDAKPLHPRGELFTAVVRRRGLAVATGSPWLDDPGEDAGLVRLSRSAGLPGALPDILGLALRVGADRPHDLLLATAGAGVPGRFVPHLRRDPAATYTTLVPYSAARGQLMIAARPLDGAARTFALEAATPLGAWRTFAELAVGAPAPGDVSFDPVLHPLPGAVLPEPLARVREAAYARAREARRARPGSLEATPAGSRAPAAP